MRSTIARFPHDPQNSMSAGVLLKAYLILTQLPFNVQLFVGHYNSVDIEDIKGQTALICAARSGHVEVVEALIKGGANVNRPDNHGRRALIHATEFGHVEVVEALLKNGANVQSKDNDSRTALMFAQHYEHIDVANVLIKAGA